MPTYEMPMLLKIMNKMETVTLLKRTADKIFKEGGFLRKIDNLGKKKTAFKITRHGEKFTDAQVFLFHFDIPPSSIDYILKEYKRDVDIIKIHVYQKNIPKNDVCRFHEETLAPPFREDVKQMMELSKRKALVNNFREKYFKDLQHYPI